jgi:hypothetical protein
MPRNFTWQLDEGDDSLFDQVRLFFIHLFIHLLFHFISLFGNKQVLIEQRDWECPSQNMNVAVHRSSLRLLLITETYSWNPPSPHSED